MGEVEGPRGVLPYGEMQRLDAQRGCVGAVVAGRDELGTAEAFLNSVCIGGKHRRVTGKRIGLVSRLKGKGDLKLT